MERMSAGKLRENLADILNRVAYAGQRVVIHRRGKDAAVLVPTADFERILKWEREEETSNLMQDGTPNPGPGAETEAAPTAENVEPAPLLRLAGGEFIHDRSLFREIFSRGNYIGVSINELPGIMGADSVHELRKILHGERPAPQEFIDRLNEWWKDSEKEMKRIGFGRR